MFAVFAVFFWVEPDFETPWAYCRFGPVTFPFMYTDNVTYDGTTEIDDRSKARWLGYEARGRYAEWSLKGEDFLVLEQAESVHYWRVDEIRTSPNSSRKSRSSLSRNGFVAIIQASCA